MTLRGILIALPISLGLWLVILNVTAGLAACNTGELCGANGLRATALSSLRDEAPDGSSPKASIAFAGDNK